MAKASSVSPAEPVGNGLWNAGAGTSPGKTTHPLDWRKRMSDTVAYALLVYTALQIVVTMHVLTKASASMLPLVALVVLVAGIIPLFRHYERHWERLDDQSATDPDRRPLYHRDQLSVWLCAIGLPFAITGLFKVGVALLG